VKVEKVRTSASSGRSAASAATRAAPDWKKAYVTLAEGSRIDFFEGA